MGFPLRDVGNQVKSVLANFSQDSSGDPKIIVAAATEDNVKGTGETINRAATRTLAQSVSLVISYQAVLAATKTISFAVERQDSADGSTWNTAVVVQAATVAATGGGGGTTEKGVVEIDESLDDHDQYVRYNVTPDLSATATDTCQFTVTAVLGGFQDSSDA